MRLKTIKLAFEAQYKIVIFRPYFIYLLTYSVVLDLASNVARNIN